MVRGAIAAQWPETPDPPVPFKPLELILQAGTLVHRVHSARYRSNQANPGGGSGGRFHFFGTPSVPVLYAAQTRDAALAETLLRNIPPNTPAPLPYSAYRDAVMAGLRTQRDARMASFMGKSLRALKIEQTQLTVTPGENYPQTRKWAAAAHAAGFDGLVWMSRQDNAGQAYLFFGDAVTETDLKPDPDQTMRLSTGTGFAWLVDACAPLHIDVLPAT